MAVGDLPIDLCWWTEIVEVVFVVLIVFLSLNRNRWFWLFADWPIDPFQFGILHQPKVLFRKILCLLPQNIMVRRGFQWRTLPSSLGKSWKTHPKIFTKFQFYGLWARPIFGKFIQTYGLWMNFLEIGLAHEREIEISKKKIMDEFSRICQ